MNKAVLLVVLALLAILAMYIASKALTGFFVGFGQPAGEFKWWNVSWHYRFRLEINSTSYSRTDWPIEQFVNFTDLLPAGTFDENSIRVFEYSQSGDILYEVPSQFEKDENFDASSNAAGTLVFLMNGTTQLNTKRIYFVYYDTVENGPKGTPSYPTQLAYSWDGQVANVNNTILRIYIDTNRGENTSGIYHVEDIGGTVVITASSNDKTAEYLQYSNGTANFTFDLRNNASFFVGPVRLVIKQEGDEVIFGNPNQKTNEGKMVKKYFIYNRAGPQQYGTFIKILQEFKNVAGYAIQRSSTPAGALAFDLNRTLSSGYIDTLDFSSTDPYSWVWGSGFGGEMVGVINLEESGTSNYYSTNSTSYGRIGIQLDQTTIPASTSIKEVALVYFAGWGGSDAVSEFLSIKDRVSNPVSITQFLPEKWYVEIIPSINATIYNRNEAMLIKANVSSGDPYNLTKYINATFDMGTPSQSDDQTIVLYDDGTHGDETAGDKIFTNTFLLPTNAEVGIWVINFTAYTSNYEFLNSTVLYFNVTDILNVTVSVVNKKPVVGTLVVANLYVKNFRQDSWIAGATINCSYDSSEVVNKVDFGNGTYSVNFTAPSNVGNYVLACNATKDGNFGNNSDTFSTEPANTSVNITIEPLNPQVYHVSLFSNDSFVITATATNFDDGTAYSANISLEMLPGWISNTTQVECGDLEKNAYCSKAFNVTVPNATQPGNYSLNATVYWKNPDGSISSNKTEINVTVNSNPLLEVEETKISSEAGDGIWNFIGNFTVFSVGNDELRNISFSCVSGTVCTDFIISFRPENISSLPMAAKYNVSVNVSISLGYPSGTYNGTVNVSAQNDKFDTLTIEVILPPKTNVSITTSIPSYTAQNITMLNSESFTFSSNATNIGNSSARFVNISLSLPTGWSSNSTLENCGNLTKEEICSRAFNVTVPNATAPGNYYVNVTATWTNLDNSISTNKTSILVTVSSNPLINVSEDVISASLEDGVETQIGNFTVLSIGNDALQGISFSCISGEVCTNFTLKFSPSSIPTLPAGSNYSVAVNVSIPLGYPSGTYNGTVNVSAQNDKYDIFLLNITVVENRTWSVYPTYCERSTQQPVGTACEINVTNLGNVQINFTVYPEEGNYTKVNETSFVVNRASWHVFNITYNATEAPPAIYNSTFTLDAVQPGSNPDYAIIKVSLLPYIPPIINISILPKEIEQNSSVKILVNVTDRSGSGISWTKVNITRPNGIVDSFSMALVSVNGSLSFWELVYPNITGSTEERGLYNITVYAKDNIGNEGEENSSFIVYAKLNILLSTLSDKYYQGDTGSIYYAVRNFTNNPVPNVTVNFTIENPQGNLIYISPQLKTNADGSISPLPTFSLPSDAPLGNYSLSSFSEYFDEITNKHIEIQKNYTFQVFSRTVTVTGLFADVETAVVWYPDNVMRFGILVYNGEGKPVDPTSMNLTVYDPANNIYFSANLSQMTKQSTGYYIYQYAMPSTTPSGMFLAVLNVSQENFQTMKLKAFRVAHGGPYDVRITLLENEVQQGSYLDFVLTVENKGEVSQDVFVEYWVSSPQNTTYYSASEAVYTPSVTNQSFTRSVYIYSTQPLGTYFLNVRVTYDTVQPSITANASFLVVARVTPTTLPPPAGPTIYVPVGAFPTPTPTEKITAGILISKYNSNITLAKGFTSFETVTVNNTGQVDLENVSLLLVGIPLAWFNITPESYKILPKDQSVVFLITFDVPENARVGSYGGTLIASSGVASDQKKVTITVVESVEELLRAEIKKLKDDLFSLEVDTKVAEKEGKDVSAIMLLIDSIKSYIKSAEENLENKKFSEALENVANAKNLLERARSMLSKAEVIVKPPSVLPFFPWLIVVLVVVSAVVAGIVFWMRKRKKVVGVRPWVIPLGRLADLVKAKKVNKEDLIKEKERLLRMLEVLEKEKEEKLVSLGAYREMKKNLEKKLAEIEKKLT
jgi:uncharacterized membrane protein